jgi:hypothetical protein
MENVDVTTLTDEELRGELERAKAESWDPSVGASAAPLDAQTEPAPSPSAWYHALADEAERRGWDLA